ncbi:nardilysin-like isoform X2 [Drosophila obscura]|uniref:nardilysin-like isoform X2 n=1 Tax=Drosophila obscura TaxID=7282 RepID=UPI001BB1EB2C|nr:nardilysin-like isoform X2 [Drosophila obscura]
MALNIELHDLDQSVKDNKSYKSLVLQNGLRALIISDPNLEPGGEAYSYKTAALALTVDCGSFKDPPKYRGLARVLEHLLRTDEIFTPHVQKCGGESNIRTDCEETMFYFEVPETHLTSCLLHLTALLLKQDTLERERLPNIEDLQRNVEDYKMQRNKLLASLASDDYPHGLYDWENLAELKEEDPEDAFATMIQKLRRDNYVANQMHVCLQARLPLDELEQMIYRHFAVIPCNDNESTDLTQSFDYRSAFRAQFHEHVFYVNSTDDKCLLELTWLLPSVWQYYHSKPERFVAFLLSQEGAGSLCVYLQRRRWSVHLVAGIDDNGFDLNSIYSLFKISIQLTAEGCKHIDEVLAATFAYIKLIAATEPQVNLAAVHNVQDLVLNSKHYPVKDVLTAGKLYYEYDQQQLSEMIGFLNKMDFNLVIIRSGDTASEDSTPMPGKWQQLWRESKPIEELCLPEPNRFVAEDFTIFWLEQGQPELPSRPTKLIQTRVCELWHRLDDTFAQPKATMSFYFISPLQRQSARKEAMCSLYVNLVEGQLVEQIYPAAIAGLRYAFTVGEKGLVLKVRGYNEKLHLVVEAIAQAMVNVGDTVEDWMHTDYRDNLREFHFYELVKSRLLCRDIRQCVLKESRWLCIDKYKSINGISLDDFKAFARKFREELYIQALIEGNYTAESATDVMNDVIRRLQCRPIREPRFLEDRVKELPLGSHCIRCRALNECDPNTVIMNYYQIGPNTMRIQSLLDLMMIFLQNPIYNYLCAQEKLCHYVFPKVRLYYGIIGYSITASSKHTLKEASGLEQAMDKFRLKMLQILKKMCNEEFLRTKEKVIAAKLAPDEDLTIASDRHWEEIVNGDYLFDRNQQLADALRNLTKNEMFSFLMHTDAANLRKLSIQVIGYSPTEWASGYSSDKTNCSSDAFFETTQTPSSASEDALGYRDVDEEESLYEDLGNRVSLVFLPRDGGTMNTIVDIDDFKTSLDSYPRRKLLPENQENQRTARLELALRRSAARFQPN